MEDLKYTCFLLLTVSVFSSITSATFPVPAPSIAQPRADGIDYRLPTHIKPIHYEIALDVNLENFTFTGFTSIEVEVLEEANNITLHVNQLNIATLTVWAASSDVLEDASWTNDTTTHFLIINFEEKVKVGMYYINLTFDGAVNDGNTGFYRAAYSDIDGNTRWLATTQFEPTHAREAFPCFDEPYFKAQFTISITRSANYTSISNMPLLETRDLGDGRFEDSFETSVTMPTYLVAFIVSDYSFVSRDNQSVYARSELIDDGRGDYALDVGIATIDVMEDFTNISYALEKLYQAAIPDSYYYFGAMENWGLVTYKERYLLYKENVTTSSEKQSVTTIIAHELSHQWFGNLVTCEWWSYIWLNEGFATYFEHYATSLVQPTWRLMDQFLLKSVQYAFESDGLETTRPMTFDAGSPSEIEALFDRVAYDKSGAVIRMAEHFLTTPVFKTGLNIYLNNRSYNTATPSDLWNGLQVALDTYNGTVNIPENESVESILNTWQSQAGYPVINIDRNYITGSINVSQSRFLLNNASHDLEELWIIPINYATAENLDFSDTAPTLWLTERYQTYATFLNTDSWVIFNKQETGYYRVNYDEANWKLITDYLKGKDFEKIHVLNRAQLVDDAFNLARSGRLSYKVLLDLADYITQETDYAPLYSLFTGLTYLNRYLIGTDIYEEFKSFIVDHLQTAYRAVGTNLVKNEDITDVYNRINLINWLCLYGDDDCQSKMNEQLSQELRVHPDMQASVYCGGMRKGTFTNWQYLYQLYTSDVTEEREKSRLITALGCSLDAEILKRYFQATLGWEDDYPIRSSDVASALSAIYSGSDVGFNFTFYFLLDNFENITNSLTTSQVSSVLSGVSLRLTSQQQLTLLLTFIEGLNETLRLQFEGSFTTAINNVNANLVWYDNNIDAITVWFDDYQNVTDTTVASTTKSTTITITSGSTTITTDTPPSSTPANPDDDSSDDASLKQISWLIFVICTLLLVHF